MGSEVVDNGSIRDSVIIKGAVAGILGLNTIGVDSTTKFLGSIVGEFAASNVIFG